MSIIAPLSGSRQILRACQAEELEPVKKEKLPKETIVEPLNKAGKARGQK
jgi:hypothetical protein